MNESGFSNHSGKSAFVSMREATDILGISTPTIRLKEAAGEMPKRVALGQMRGGKSGRPAKTGWPRGVFEAWLESLAKESAAGMQSEAST